jgi:hypothetical protein
MAAQSSASDKAEARILFQDYFKSVGPRTYAAQVKEASNGNHFLVLMEGKRDEKTGEIRKTRLFVFSEDFGAFFRMIEKASAHTKAHPVPADVRKKRERFWAKKTQEPAERPQSHPLGKPESESPNPGQARIAEYRK